jgi:hypothetical protein
MSGSDHIYHRMRRGGCAVLDDAYEFRFGDTPDDFRCPHAHHIIGAQPAIWFRERGEREWRFVSYW